MDHGSPPQWLTPDLILPLIARCASASRRRPFRRHAVARYDSAVVTPPYLQPFVLPVAETRREGNLDGYWRANVGVGSKPVIVFVVVGLTVDHRLYVAPVASVARLAASGRGSAGRSA